MKASINITATLDQPDLLENLVEKLAYRRYAAVQAVRDGTLNGGGGACPLSYLAAGAAGLRCGM